MLLNLEKLFRFAITNPWYLFTGEQIAELCNVGQHLVTRVRNAQDSPFRNNKCRPEWFIHWIKTHPDSIEGKIISQPHPFASCAHCATCKYKIKPAKTGKEIVQQYMPKKFLPRKKAC